MALPTGPVASSTHIAGGENHTSLAVLSRCVKTTPHTTNTLSHSPMMLASYEACIIELSCVCEIYDGGVSYNRIICIYVYHSMYHLNDESQTR